MSIIVGNSVTVSPFIDTWKLDDSILVRINGTADDVFGAFVDQPDQFAIYDADGTLLAGPVTLPDAIDDDEFWHIRADSDGGFTVFYRDPSGDNLGATTSFDAELKITGTGTYETGSETVNFSGFNIETETWDDLEVATDLPNGGIVGLVQADTGIDDPKDIVVVMNSAGGVTGEFEYAFASTPVETSSPKKQIAVSGDRWLITHQEKVLGAEENGQIYGIIMNSDGTIAVPEFEITEGDLQGSNTYSVATTFGGKFVIVWAGEMEGLSENDEVDIWVKVLNADGSVSQAQTKVNKRFNDLTQEEPLIHIFEDGTFAITFDTFYLDGGLQRTGIIQLFDEDGAKIGNNQQLFAANMEAQNSVILEDGEGLIGTGNPFFDPAGAMFPVDIALGETIDDVNAGDGSDDDDDEPIVTGDSPTNGDDVLLGTNRKDKVNLKRGDDVYTAQGGKDDVKGAGGEDRIFGGKGNDKLNGGNGEDTLFGDEGKDRLIGGKGDDLLYGGAGRDTFDFSKGKTLGTDFISDFEANKDRIDLSSRGFKALEVTDDGVNTFLDFGRGEITLGGVVLTEDEITFI
ncbi:MAG: hypothetical protein AAFQ36_08705 [Pseudomonadota bacterium]